MPASLNKSTKTTKRSRWSDRCCSMLMDDAASNGTAESGSCCWPCNNMETSSLISSQTTSRASSVRFTPTVTLQYTQYIHNQQPPAREILATVTASVNVSGRTQYVYSIYNTSSLSSWYYRSWILQYFINRCIHSNDIACNTLLLPVNVTVIMHATITVTDVSRLNRH